MGARWLSGSVKGASVLFFTALLSPVFFFRVKSLSNIAADLSSVLSQFCSSFQKLAYNCECTSLLDRESVINFMTRTNSSL